jgi:methionine-rich copper-binding protein CopC
MNPMFPRSFRKASLLAAILCLSATQVWAHAKLDHAEPAVDGAVKQSPTEVRLTFSEGVEVSFCRVQVLDAAGQQVDKKDVHSDPKKPRELIVSLPASLGAGAYKVIWRAVAADTHVTNGEFTFRIEP